MDGCPSPLRGGGEREAEELPGRGAGVVVSVVVFFFFSFFLSFFSFFFALVPGPTHTKAQSAGAAAEGSLQERPPRVKESEGRRTSKERSVVFVVFDFSVSFFFAFPAPAAAAARGFTALNAGAATTTGMEDPSLEEAAIRAPISLWSSPAACDKGWSGRTTTAETTAAELESEEAFLSPLACPATALAIAATSSRCLPNTKRVGTEQEEEGREVKAAAEALPFSSPSVSLSSSSSSLRRGASALP